MSNTVRLWTVLILLWAGAIALGMTPMRTFAQSASPDVLVLTAEGAVTPAMRDYIERGIATAEEQGVNAIVIQLDTPGGQIEITQEIVQIIRQSPIPIIVFVSPAGAQAASAGSIITAAAHLAGMAPNTVIGATSPVDGSGNDIGETLYNKISEDLQATMRALLEGRAEEALQLGEEMIVDARAVTAAEALEAGFIDLIAADIDDLLTQIDGQQVEIDGRSMALQVADARLLRVRMNTLEAVLHLLANPNVLAILVAIAVPAIIIELRTPGGWVAGLIGVVALLLSLYGFGQLPVNLLGLGLVVVAFGLLTMEAFTPAFGALAFAGSLTLIAGLLVLFNSPGSPQFARIRLSTAIGVALPAAAFFLWVGIIALKAQRLTPITGTEGMIGQIGQVRAPLDPKGTVFVNGELWQATHSGDEPLDAGKLVVVEEVDKFLITVRRKT